MKARRRLRGLAWAGLLGGAVLLSAGPVSAESFCGLPGACEPTAYGTLEVTLLGPDNKPLDRPVALFVPDPRGDGRVQVAAGRTGRPLRLIAADYTLRIEGVRPPIEAPVTIRSDRTTIFRTAGFGKLLVRLDGLDGKPALSRVGVETEGQSPLSVASGDTNALIDVPAGAYAVTVATRPPTTLSGVRIAHGETRELSLPALGGLRVEVRDRAGRTLALPFRLHPLGDAEKVLAAGRTGADIPMAPGSYDVLVEVTPPARIANVRIESGRLLRKMLPQRGAVRLEIPDAAGKPLDAEVQILSAEGRPLAKGRSGVPIDIGPGRYDLRVGLVPPAVIKGVRVEAGKLADKRMQRLGRVFGAAVTRDGKERKATVSLYRPGSRDRPIASFPANRPVEVIPGTYDFEITGPTSIWYEKIAVTSGTMRILKPLEPGRLLIRFKGPDGKWLDGYPIWAFRAGDRSRVVKAGRSGVPMVLPPGRYELRIGTKKNQEATDRSFPAIWLRGRVVPGELIEATSLPPWGRLRVRGEMADDLTLFITSPKKGQRRCRPAAGQIHSPGIDAPLFLPPSVYLVSIEHRPITGPQRDYCTFIEIPPGATRELVFSKTEEAGVLLVSVGPGEGPRQRLRPFTFTSKGGYEEVKRPGGGGTGPAGPGLVLVRVKAPGGRLIGGIPVEAYAVGTSELVAAGEVNKPLALAPGRYDLRLTIGPVGDWSAPMAPFVWARKVEVTAGSRADVTLGPWGRLAARRSGGGLSPPSLVVYRPDPRKKNCEDYRQRGGPAENAPPFLNLPPRYQRSPVLVPPGDYVIMLHDTLAGAGRASMVCLARPVRIGPGERVDLELKEVRTQGGSRFTVPGHETRVVF